MTPQLSKPVLTALNEAVGQELYAQNLYLNLAIQMQGVGYFGCAKYFKSESESEFAHAQIITDYINDRGLVATVPMISKQTDIAKTIKEAFTVSLDAEMDLEKFYLELYERCEEETDEGGYGDCQTAIFLQELLIIQRKAVGEVRDYLATIERCGSNEAALLIFDGRFL